MLIYDTVWYYPSALDDAIVEQNRLFEAHLKALRAGDQIKSRQLLVQLQKANQRRLELTLPPNWSL